GDRVDDVDALVEERLGQLLALGGVTPGVVAADEGAGLLGRVPAEELDVRAVLLVVDLGTGVHAIHEPGHARELLAAVGAELLARAEAGGEVTRERRRLVDLEVQ